MYGLFRIIVYAVLFYLILKVVNFLTSGGQNRKQRRQPERLSGVMVKDEICNTYIPKEDAIREVREGQEHFFCSQECRKKFLHSKKKSA
jgi:uncharacterized protein